MKQNSTKYLFYKAFYILTAIVFPIAIYFYVKNYASISQNMKPISKRRKSKRYKDINNLSLISTDVLILASDKVKIGVKQELSETNLTYFDDPIKNIIFNLLKDLENQRYALARSSFYYLLKNDRYIFRKVRSAYFQTDYFINPAYFEITKLFLIESRNAGSMIMLFDMIKIYPLNFSDDQYSELLYMYVKLAIIQKESLAETLLCCFVAKEYKKVEILLKFGASPSDLNCLQVEYKYDCNIFFDDSGINKKHYFAPLPAHFGRKLKDVLLESDFMYPLRRIC